MHKVLINPFNPKKMPSLCSLPHTLPSIFPPTFFFFSPTCFSLRLFLFHEGLHNKANDNPGSLILKREVELCWIRHKCIPVILRFSTPYVLEHLYKEVFLWHSHCLYLLLLLLSACTHIHTCLQKQRLFLRKLCRNSVLPQINHFLPKEANTFATWLEWAGGFFVLKYSPWLSII